MLGDSQIGKTSLMVKYVEGHFDEDYIQTLGSWSLLLAGSYPAHLTFPPATSSPRYPSSLARSGLTSHPTLNETVTFLRPRSTLYPGVVGWALHCSPAADVRPSRDLGVNFMEKTISVRRTSITFSLWDLGGQREFVNMLPLVCNDAVAILFMFDLSRKSTLNSVKEWYRQARGFNKVSILATMRA